MSRRFYTGIDIGTHQVKVVIATPGGNQDLPMQVVGSGSAATKGMRQGYVAERAEVARSIREALARAQSAAKATIKSARIAIGGIGIEEVRGTGEISLTAAGGLVNEREVEKVLRESEKRASSKLTNRTVLHTIPLEYRVDGTKVFGRPVGLQGTKLSVDTLLITVLSQHHDELLEAVEAAGIEVEGDPMASPLAASLVTLNKAQKTAGVCLLNIGSETVSLVVYDEDVPVSIKVFPIGSADVTNAMALAFQLPLAEAEHMKRGAVTGSDIPTRKIQSIVAARSKEMFSLVNTHLKSIGRSRLLPAGVVIIGGGATQQIADVARMSLKLPSQIGVVGQPARSAGLDVTWAVAYGLCRWAYAEEHSESSSIGDIFRGIGESLRNLFRSLLP